jgi:hypothetical protein
MRKQKAKGKKQKTKPPAAASPPVVDASPVGLIDEPNAQLPVAASSDAANAISPAEPPPEPARNEPIDSSLSATALKNEPAILPSPTAVVTDERRSAFHENNATKIVETLSPNHWLDKIISRRRAVLIVTVTAAIISLASFIYFFSQGMTNHYGDGLAHVNIARKVVDSPDASLWQRYIQIGSPWLPLPTVLMLPLVANDWMWRTGVAGSLVSMVSFVIATVALYLLARIFYRDEDNLYREGLPFLSVAIFAFNPSAVFMQATPMTELVFMAALVVAVYLLQRWVLAPTVKHLLVAAMAMTMATLARYEAWPVAMLSVLIVALAATGEMKTKIRTVTSFAVIVATGPLYWLWHNWMIYGNAFEFFTGPHSARGVFLENQANLGWAKIFVGHAWIDFLLMLATAAVCIGPLLVAMGAIGSFRFILINRRKLIENAPVLLLIVPFFFHIFSLYRGEIQISPFSVFGLLNVRYGLPHLLAVALFAPSCVLMFKRARRWAMVAACALVALQYGQLISEGPSQLAVYQEGYRNGVNKREARERQRAVTWMHANPSPALIWMNTGALGPLVSQGGLRFSEIIHEGTLRSHAINDRIPDDVATVIVQDGDPLDQQLRDNPLLARDLADHFQMNFTAGKIHLYRRR